MNERVKRTMREHAASKPLEVPNTVVDETVALARELVDSGEERSLASATTRAARDVAGRHATMPGPIMAAIARRDAGFDGVSEDETWAVGDVVVLGCGCMGNDPGAPGIVYEVYDLGDGPSPAVIFPNGEYDGFSSGDLELFGVEKVGRVTDEYAREYTFDDVMRLYDDFKLGRFRPAFTEARRIVSGATA